MCRVCGSPVHFRSSWPGTEQFQGSLEKSEHDKLGGGRMYWLLFTFQGVGWLKGTREQIGLTERLKVLSAQLSALVTAFVEL